ncbi:MAG TPA: hypothetical protein PKC49_02505 [Phycisphaerae bacterium]|nr:hypothetical protein [Phycisphaerae bacterium]
MRRGGYLLLIGSLGLLSGCAILTDVFNPDTLPSFIAPDPGVVVVAFHNDSDFPAIMGGGVSFDSNLATFEIFGVTVGANSTISRVFDCPVTLISAGPPDGGVAAVVLTADGIEVEGPGVPLTSGGFRCGDVVEIRLIQIGPGPAAEDYRIQVRVLPGR